MSGIRINPTEKSTKIPIFNDAFPNRIFGISELASSDFNLNQTKGGHFSNGMYFAFSWISSIASVGLCLILTVS